MKNRSPSPHERVCANRHCRRGNIHAGRRCQACYTFWKRNGRDARPADMRARGAAPGKCQNCGGNLIYARGRCKACYQYRLRTGRERPAAGQRSADGLCRVCHARSPYRRGRCRSCYAYLRLYRKDRAGR